MVLLNSTDLSDYFMDFTGGHYDFVAWDPRGVGLSTSAPTLSFSPSFLIFSPTQARPNSGIR